MPVMRRARDPGGLQQVLAAEDQTGALRPAQALAAAVAYERGAALQVDVGNGQHLGRRVGEHGDILLLGNTVDGVVGERTAFHTVAGHDVHHRHFRTERGFVFRCIAHLDDAHAHRADRLIVFVARGLRDHHLVFREAGQVRDAHVQVGIAARHARRRGVRHARPRSPRRPGPTPRRSARPAGARRLPSARPEPRNAARRHPPPPAPPAVRANR